MAADALRWKLAEYVRHSAWNNKQQEYLPKEIRIQFISKENIVSVVREDPTVQSANIEAFSDHIYNNAHVLFTIFIVYRVPISLLERLSYTDSDLPLRFQPGGTKGLTYEYVRFVPTGQWLCLAAEFSSEGPHQVLDPNTVLPFRSSVKVGEGTFGTVSKVEIEPSHVNQAMMRPLALKVIIRRKETDGINERMLLEGLRSVGHPHIIELLTSFEIEDRIGMFFPLATYDLHRYMCKEGLSFDDQYVSWLLNQLRGLTDALSKIHEYYPDSTESGPNDGGYHHDLKPQNILFFQDKDRPLQGVFKISDFGVAKFQANQHNTSTSHANTRTITHTVAKFGTLMYAPPDVGLEGAPPNLYDMWLLQGILETVVNGLLIWDPQGRWTSTRLKSHFDMLTSVGHTPQRSGDLSPPPPAEGFQWHEKGQYIELGLGERRPLLLGPRLGESKAGVFKVFCRSHLLALKLIEAGSGNEPVTATNEIQILRALKHPHIVQLVGSYRRQISKQRQEVGLLLYPAAQWNLEGFLNAAVDRRLEEDISALDTFFGCLSRIVRVLHDGCVKYKDIKPQNILVNENNVFFSDFGISRHFHDGVSITSGPSRQTRRYSAPEVASFNERGRAADIFSLGCVFLEMLSVIHGHRVNDLLEYLGDDEKSRNYSDNPHKIEQWIEEKLKGKLAPRDSYRLNIISKMLDKDPQRRPGAKYLDDEFGRLSRYGCRLCNSKPTEEAELLDENEYMKVPKGVVTREQV
ncbi:hypothetical protein O1611_g660 [Lasiodiplodia mahajangana]|uniref:Uncharacterized protein n=1 Tax=Lasiodiplodia mahajangana TaxID=1108764 RepID=A0ACC2JZY2_9PEZI|nr:hypothetical protein O1611_g660 [Lasiodiplodia mahajangana]